MPRSRGPPPKRPPLCTEGVGVAAPGAPATRPRAHMVFSRRPLAGVPAPPVKSAARRRRDAPDGPNSSGLTTPSSEGSGSGAAGAGGSRPTGTRSPRAVGRGGRENNRLGLGDVVDHWTPTAVPAWDNVTVHANAHYTDIILKCTCRHAGGGDVRRGTVTPAAMCMPRATRQGGTSYE